MYNKTTNIIVFLLLIILNNSQINQCNCDTISIHPAIQDIRVLSDTDGYKILVSRISLYSEQKIDIARIKPFIYYGIREAGKKNSLKLFEFPVRQWGFKSIDILADQKEESNSKKTSRIKTKKQKQEIVINSMLHLRGIKIEKNLKDFLDEYQNNTLRKKNFEFTFIVEFKYNGETSENQEFATKMISSDLNSWITKMFYSSQNNSNTHRLDLLSGFRFLNFRDYTNFYKPWSDLNEKDFMNRSELCTDDLFPINENYGKNVKSPSIETRNNQGMNAHRKKTVPIFDLRHRKNKAYNENNGQINSNMIDNFNTSVSEEAMGSDSRGLQNTENGGMYIENQGSKDTGIDGPGNTRLNGTDNTRFNGTDNSRSNSTDNSRSNSTDNTGINGPSNTGTNGPSNTGINGPSNTGINGTYNNRTSGTVNTRLDGFDSTRTSGSVTSPGNIETSGDIENNPNEPEKKSKSIKIIGIIVISIVLFGVSLYFYFIIKRIYFTKKEVEYVY